MRTAALTVAILLAIPASVRGQLSPGPLARPHRALEGTRNCLTCHGTKREAMDGACLACHREVAWLRDQGRGLHAGNTAQRCATCHPDHGGERFDLVAWNADSASRFDHARARWPLDGAHREATCTDCHTSDLRSGPVLRLLPPGNDGPVWLGLEQQCASCHEDVHRRTVSSDCTSCHTSAKWIPAARFSHDSTEYPLTGRHRDVPCASCHAPGRGGAPPREGVLDPVFRALDARECSSCHQDVHGGLLGVKCSSCHVTAGFGELRPGSFDHARTRYPLEGRHGRVACADCHGPAGERPRPAFAACGSCHADAHGGTATLLGRPADCADCHTVRGFAPSSFTTAQHASAAYPIEGRHTAVSCRACHTDGPVSEAGTARVRLRVPFATCSTCHGEPHGGQLTTRPDSGACAACHDVAGWSSSTYRATEHAEYALPLEGRHAEIRCGACHAAERAGLPPISTGPADPGTARVVFAIGSSDCTACHADPHQGRYTGAGVRLREGGCSECHDARAFRPATLTLAAHGELGFELRGAHRAVSCAQCHTGLARPAGGAALIEARTQPGALELTLPDTSCAGCHVDRHAGQFADRGGCAACHGQDSFAPATGFDHSTAAFRLEGAHQAVLCGRCHVPAADGRDSVVVRYRGIPVRCEACHPGKPGRAA